MAISSEICAVSALISGKLGFHLIILRIRRRFVRAHYIPLDDEFGCHRMEFGVFFFNKNVLNEIIINIKWWFVPRVGSRIDILAIFDSKYRIICITIKCNGSFNLLLMTSMKLELMWLVEFVSLTPKSRYINGIREAFLLVCSFRSLEFADVLFIFCWRCSQNLRFREMQHRYSNIDKSNEITCVDKHCIIFVVMFIVCIVW